MLGHLSDLILGDVSSLQRGAPPGTPVITPMVSRASSNIVYSRYRELVNTRLWHVFTRYTLIFMEDIAVRDVDSIKLFYGNNAQRYLAFNM